MILNNSRAKLFNACSQAAYNREVRRLGSREPISALLIGGGFHSGIQVINSKKGTLQDAVNAATKKFASEVEWDRLLPEQVQFLRKDQALLEAMVQTYGEFYLKEDFEVLRNEVSFRVALPFTEHHCWFFHNVLQRQGAEHVVGDSRFDYKTKSWDQCTGWDPDDSAVPLPCWQPHYLVGTADALLAYKNGLWLQEHKTTAYDLYNDSPQSKNWIANWALDTQATCYTYGIWKQLGIKPQGVLLNVIIKPRKNAKIPEFKFYREAFLRTDAQLLNYEKQVIRQANRIEQAMRTGDVWQNPNSCFNYNRRCEYHKMCVTLEEPRPVDFLPRNDDYVDSAYLEVLGLRKPTKETPNVRTIDED